MNITPEIYAAIASLLSGIAVWAVQGMRGYSWVHKSQLSSLKEEADRNHARAKEAEDREDRYTEAIHFLRDSNFVLVDKLRSNGIQVPSMRRASDLKFNVTDDIADYVKRGDKDISEPSR